MAFKLIVVCTLACFVQNALSQISIGGVGCGCQPNQAINLGNLSNLGFSLSNGANGLTLSNAASGNGFNLNNGASGLNNGNAICLNSANGLNIASGNGLSLGNSLPGNSVLVGNVPSNGISVNNGCNNGILQGTSPQIGYGDLAIVGELPVVGPTAVSGNVPVVGYVMFEGQVPAGGLVSVVNPCGCGCNQ